MLYKDSNLINSLPKKSYNSLKNMISGEQNKVSLEKLITKTKKS